MVPKGSGELCPLTTVLTCEGNVAPALVMSRTPITENCLLKLESPTNTIQVPAEEYVPVMATSISVCFVVLGVVFYVCFLGFFPPMC